MQRMLEFISISYIDSGIFNYIPCCGGGQSESHNIALWRMSPSIHIFNTKEHEE